MKLWDVFEGKGNVETFTHTHDVLTVVYRPDSKQIACSTLDGHIHFWDPIEGVEMASIDGRRDIKGGRLMGDRRTAENSSAGKSFTSLSYSADGSFILAGGSSKYICMYDVAEQVSLIPTSCSLYLSCSLFQSMSFLNLRAGHPTLNFSYGCHMSFVHRLIFSKRVLTLSLGYFLRCYCEGYKSQITKPWMEF